MNGQHKLDAVQNWLDEAATAMAGHPVHRKDALLELETSIYERIEERSAGADASDELVRDVLEMMGDPVEVGSSMMPGQPLVAHHRTRPFLVHVGMVFAVHFLLVIGATLAGQEWALPPFRIQPIADPNSLIELFGCAAKTLVFDAGLVLVFYVLLQRLERILRFPRVALAVRADPRRCLESAFFLALVLVVIDFFRDNLLAIYLPADEGTVQLPLVGPGIVDNLLLLNLWLGTSIMRELLYARLGERRLTLGVDILACAAGLFCLLRIVATKQLVDLSRAQEALGAAADGVGGLLNAVFVLLALATAALLAARAVRRSFRWALLRR